MRIKWILSCQILAGFVAGLCWIGVWLGKKIGFLGYLLGGVTGAVVAIRGLAGNFLSFRRFQPM
jgi:hypothetical protein